MSNIRPISPELQIIARKELNEVDSRIPEDLQHIKDWLKKQRHLQKVQPDDQLILTFLRGCKYSLEKSKSKLDAYYSLKSAIPEWFRGRYPFSVVTSDMLKSSSLMILPRKDATPKPVVCLMRFVMDNPENFTLDDLFRCWLMALEAYFRDNDDVIVCGVDVIFDYSLLHLNYALQLTPTLIKKVISIAENAFPIRLKNFYGIDTPPIVEALYKMFVPLVKSKITERVCIYSANNRKEFYKKIPQHVLPKEYGGENPSVHELAARINKMVESYGKRFLDNEENCSNEALRPTNIRSPKSVFGLEGSFRKLNLD